MLLLDSYNETVREVRGLLSCTCDTKRVSILTSYYAEHETSLLPEWEPSLVQ